MNSRLESTFNDMVMAYMRF